MLVETAMLLGGALATAAVGMPIAARIAQPQAFRRHAPRDPSTNRRVAESVRAFEPLDLGPDPMKWPSEVARQSHAVPEPPWPSQTWDDPHFGKLWATGGAGPSDSIDGAWKQRREQTQQRQEAEAQRVAEERRRRAQESQAQQQARARALQEEQANAQRSAAQMREELHRRAQEARERFEAAQAAPEQLRQAATRAAREQANQAIQGAAGAIGLDGAPSAEEIERLVASVGLAGTVQEIMGRTGWDFRQAAQHLARVRQKGR